MTHPSFYYLLKDSIQRLIESKKDSLLKTHIPSYCVISQL